MPYSIALPMHFAIQPDGQSLAKNLSLKLTLAPADDGTGEVQE
jgi:hypothetical protein